MEQEGNRLHSKSEVVPYCCGLMQVGLFTIVNGKADDSTATTFKRDCENYCDSCGVNLLTATTTDNQKNVEQVMDATPGWVKGTSFYSRGTGALITVWYYKADDQRIDSEEDDNMDCEDDY